MSVEYRAWSDDLLPALVRFWNRSFASRRNSFPITNERFRERVLEKRTAIERFDPSTFLVAVEQGEIQGAIHGSARPEELCRILVPDWPGGSQGYVAFLFVAPERRKKGIGTELWHRLHAALAGVKQMVIDGQCINPFYGNSEGPFTPFWGTPEGISIEWSDSATKQFLARRGFAPRFKGVQLELRLAQAKIESAEVAGIEVRVASDVYPELGVAFGTAARYQTPGPFEVAAALSQGKTVGVLGWYPLREVGPGRVAIYEAIVLEDFQGKGIGRALLGRALARMKETGAEVCDVLTLPEASKAAHDLYLSAGFAPCVQWAIY